MILFFVILTISVYTSIFWALVYFFNTENMSDKQSSFKPGLSIIIPAYNEEKIISHTIKSCLSLNYPPSLLDIIVVDDGSTDKTFKIARSFKEIRVFKKKNGGKSSAINHGLKHIKHNFVMTLDADSELIPSCLKSCFSYFKDPKVMIVTPSVLTNKNKNFFHRIQWVEYLFSVFLRKNFSFLNCQHVAPGPGSIFRKKLFDEIGDFDTNNLTEDMDIALRTQKAGYKITNSLSLIVFTEPPSTFNSLKKQRVRWYRGGIDNLIKHRKMIGNSKYGNFGVFMLPLSIITIFNVLVLFFYNAFAIFRNLINKISIYSAINFDIAPFIKPSFDFNIYSKFLDLNLEIPMLAITVGFIGIFSIIIARNVLKTNVKRESIWSYVLFSVSYFFFIGTFWVIAIIQQMRRVKRRW